MREQWERWNIEQRDATDLTLGYVTNDVSDTPPFDSDGNVVHRVVQTYANEAIQACPGVGDDVPHVPLRLYPHPPFIGSPPPSVPDHDNSIDLVFADFIRDSVLQVVNTLNAGSKPNVTEADVKKYSELLMDEVLGVYAKAVWN
jgi:hypothetical protein